MAMTNRHAGLMSGTSLDGVRGTHQLWRRGSPHVIVSCQPFPAQIREAALSLQQAGHNELHRAALLGNQLAAVYAEATRRVVEQAGTASDQISAIGAKGSRILGTIYSA